MTESAGVAEGAAGDDASKTAKHTRRAAGVGFPSMPLGDAVSLIKKIASYGNAHTDAAVASFLGHSTSNSGPFRSKIAAMRDYGLISGKGGELAVTPLALEIVHPGLDADPQASLRAAFGKCKLFVTVMDALPKDVELELSGLANTAMHNHGVASQSKDAFASSFVKSGVLAGLVEELPESKVRIPSHGAETQDHPGDSDSEVAAFVADVRGSDGAGARAGSQRHFMPEPSNAVVNHSWPIDGGVVRFSVESTKTLPASAYGVIGAVIEAGDKLAEMLGSVSNPSGDATDSE
jgi:hypothetical protein